MRRFLFWTFFVIALIVSQVAGRVMYEILKSNRDLICYCYRSPPNLSPELKKIAQQL